MSRKQIIYRNGAFMGTRERLGSRIKELRKIRKLTQDKLAEAVGIEQKHLSRIEVGKSYPSLDTLEKIAVALNMEIMELFDFEHHEKTSKELKKSIGLLLEEADSDKLKLILRVTKDIVR